MLSSAASNAAAEGANVAEVERSRDLHPYIKFFEKYASPPWYSEHNYNNYVIPALQKKREWARVAEEFLNAFQSLSSDARRALEEVARLEEGSARETTLLQHARQPAIFYPRKSF